MLVGVGSLLALAIAVGLAVVLIVSFEDDATGDARRHTLYATAIHEAAPSAKGIANDQRGFLLSGNPEYLEEIAARTAEARAGFDAAADNAVEPAQRAAVAEPRAGFERRLRVLEGDIAASGAASARRRSRRRSAPPAS